MLNKKEIESLFTFCKKHFVYYYDVQVELVDHRANAVEAELLADPKTTFEKALQKVHQSFGIMGFAPLVAEKEKMAERQGRRLFWKLFKGHFRWPKILLLRIIVSVAFTFFSSYPDLFGIFNVPVVIGCFLADLNGFRKIRKEISSLGKKFLVVEYSQNASLFLILFYVFAFPKILDKVLLPTHGYSSILISSMVTGILIVTAMVDLQILSSLKKRLLKAYPEVFAKAYLGQ